MIVCIKRAHYIFNYGGDKLSFIRKYKRNGRVYLAEVENKRVDGKVIQVFIRYVGTDPDSERKAFPSCASELSIKKCQVYGSVLILHHIAEKLGLPKLLGEDAGPLLALVYAHCHNYRSVADTSNWFEKTDLKSILKIDKISEKNLHGSLVNLEKVNLDWLQKSIFQNISEICEEDLSGVIYDGTNTYLNGSRSRADRHLWGWVSHAFTQCRCSKDRQSESSGPHISSYQPLYGKLCLCGHVFA